MLSVIVCTQNEKRFEQLSANIKNTIGVPYEIIKTQPINGGGICNAYNIGAGLSNHEYLLFIHDDTFFHTNNWGINLIIHFKTLNEVGLIGLAGSVIKHNVLSSWWQPVLNNNQYNRYNYIQSYQFNEKNKEYHYSNPINETASHVVCLDGFFLATTKINWANNRLAENDLNGYHAYDLEYSLRLSENKKNYVIYDILLEHFSEGKIDISWMHSNLKIHKKYKNKFPIILSDKINQKDINAINQWNFYRCLEMIDELSISVKAKWLFKIQLIFTNIEILFNLNFFRNRKTILYKFYG